MSLMLNDRRESLSPQTLALVALSFAVTTYAIFTVRNVLTPDLAPELIQMRRAVATAGGGLLFWLIIRRFDLSLTTLRGGAVKLAGSCALAGLALLTLRVGFGWVDSAQAVPLELDLRWTISWVGYLGFALALFLAYQVGHAARTAAAIKSEAVTNPDAIDWLAEAIITEFDTAGPRDRRELAERLRARAGYRQADSLDERNNRRVALAERLAKRLVA